MAFTRQAELEESLAAATSRTDELQQKVHSRLLCSGEWPGKHVFTSLRCLSVRDRLEGGLVGVQKFWSCRQVEELDTAREQQEAAAAEERARADSLQGQLGSAQEEVAASRAEAADAVQRASDVEMEMSDKVARLSRLEGAPPDLLCTAAAAAIDRSQSQAADAKQHPASQCQRTALPEGRPAATSWGRDPGQVRHSRRPCRKFPQHAGELEAFQDVIGEGDQSQMLSRLVSRVAALEMAVAEAESRRRELHNQLIRLRGNVRSH